jgi:hypothetical protein
MSTRSNEEKYRTQRASYIHEEAGESERKARAKRGKRALGRARSGFTWLKIPGQTVRTGSSAARTYRESSWGV